MKNTNNYILTAIVSLGLPVKPACWSWTTRSAPPAATLTPQRKVITNGYLFSL